MTRRLTAAVLPLLVMLACSSTPAPHPVAFPSSPATLAAAPRGAIDTLRARIDSLLADPALAAGTWGIAVRSLRSGEHLVDVSAHRLLTPASTQKILTLAVAADRLGWDYTYQTRVLAAGPISNGVLDGDLIVVGSGDPSLDDWDGAASTVFRAWATRLRDIGITAITGRIIGDDHAFGGDGLGAGWMWDDLAFSYSAPASALQFNEGAAQLVLLPGSAAGQPALVSVIPPYAQVMVQGTVETVPAGSPTSVTVHPLGRSDAVGISGTIAADARAVTRTVAVDNPTTYFAAAVRAGLEANGIRVPGPGGDADDLTGYTPPAPRREVLVHHSAPLAALADTLMKLSQNMYAETLLRTVSRTDSTPGTADAGRTVVRDTLSGWGVPASEMLIVDGSGLSRYNLTTADAMASVLAHVYAEPRLRDPYVASLPIAGRAGTLAARMKGTAAEGNAHAKTGSFTNARGIAGFVQSADGEPLAFAILANNYGVPGEVVDRVSDAIVVALAEFSRGT